MMELCFLSGMDSKDWAAWVQALGPLLAFVLAIALMRIDRRQRAEDAAKLEKRRRDSEELILAEQLRHIHTTCVAAFNGLETYGGAFNIEESSQGLLSIFTDSLEAVRSINLLTLADPTMAVRLSRLRVRLRDLIAALNSGGDLHSALQSTGQFAAEVLEQMYSAPSAGAST
jgi:hypothetical protein